jgi:hypothetical protein
MSASLAVEVAGQTHGCCLYNEGIRLKCVFETKVVASVSCAQVSPLLLIFGGSTLVLYQVLLLQMPLHFTATDSSWLFIVPPFPRKLEILLDRLDFLMQEVAKCQVTDEAPYLRFWLIVNKVKRCHYGPGQALMAPGG